MIVAIAAAASFSIGDVLAQRFEFEAPVETLIMTEFFIAAFPYSERYFNDVALKCGIDTLTIDRKEIANIYSAFGSPRIFQSAMGALAANNETQYEQVMEQLICK